MSTVTVAATVEASNVPPRVRLDVTSSDATSTTLTRLNPDGTTTPVRTADGNPLPITGGTALIYDYEMPLARSVTYGSLESPASTSAAVTVDSSLVWLVHPGVPALSMPVMIKEFGERTYPTARGVFRPMGRATAVVVTDGTRKAAEFDLTLVTLTDADRLGLVELLSDSAPLLLNVPATKPFGVGVEYVSIGDVTEGRPVRIAAEPTRTWKLSCTVVDRPVGGSQSQRTWADVIATYATWNDVTAAYPTWTALLAGP